MKFAIVGAAAVLLVVAAVWIAQANVATPEGPEQVEQVAPPGHVMVDVEAEIVTGRARAAAVARQRKLEADAEQYNRELRRAKDARLDTERLLRGCALKLDRVVCNLEPMPTHQEWEWLERNLGGRPCPRCSSWDLP